MEEDFDPQQYPKEFIQQVHNREIRIQTTQSILNSPNPEASKRVLSIISTIIPPVDQSKSKQQPHKSGIPSNPQQMPTSHH